jgi:hypothetical protein
MLHWVSKGEIYSVAVLPARLHFERFGVIRPMLCLQSAHTVTCSQSHVVNDSHGWLSQSCMSMLTVKPDAGIIRCSSNKHASHQEPHSTAITFVQHSLVCNNPHHSPRQTCVKLVSIHVELLQKCAVTEAQQCASSAHCTCSACFGHTPYCNTSL